MLCFWEEGYLKIRDSPQVVDAHPSIDEGETYLAGFVQSPWHNGCKLLGCLRGELDGTLALMRFQSVNACQISMSLCGSDIKGGLLEEHALHELVRVLQPFKLRAMHVRISLEVCPNMHVSRGA